jgi:hypothetical protein
MAEYTTSETLTDDQVWQFRGAAAIAGDIAALIICDEALEGDDDAWAKVAEMISDAEAMGD